MNPVSSPRVARLLVLAPNWLGDAVLALPAIEDLRRLHGDARIIVAARPSVAGLFRLVSAIDEVVELEWTGRWWDLMRFAADAGRLRAVAAELAVLLPNSFGSALLAWSARVPARWGMARDGRGPLLTRAVPPPPASTHQSDYYRQLIPDAIDRSVSPALLEVSPEATDAGRRLLVAHGWDGGTLVALAPGAAYGSAKRWTPAHVTTLVARLVSERGATCVLVGSGADATTTTAVRLALDPEYQTRVIDLAGQTTLDELAGVLALAHACVSNDSGAMHVAAGVGVPVVAVFGPTNEAETAPVVRAGGCVEVLTHAVPCRPCMLRECPIEHPCMIKLTPDRVFEVVERVGRWGDAA